MQKEGFDLYTKAVGSPSKSAKRSRSRPDPTAPAFSGKYNPEDLATGTGRLSEDELRKAQLARADPFGALGVGSADKMTFFLLKWVFNAIKRDSTHDDPHFKGASFISKADLIKQLAKNPELLRALGYEDQRQLQDGVKNASGKKDGFLMWSEFLDFFFLATHDRGEGNDWWNQLDSKGNFVTKKEEVTSQDEKEKDPND